MSIGQSPVSRWSSERRRSGCGGLETPGVVWFGWIRGRGVSKRRQMESSLDLDSNAIPGYHEMLHAVWSQQAEADGPAVVRRTQNASSLRDRLVEQGADVPEELRVNTSLQVLSQ